MAIRLSWLALLNKIASPCKVNLSSRSYTLFCVRFLPLTLAELYFVWNFVSTFHSRANNKLYNIS